jgi:predicted transcriptional regulator
MQEDVSRRIIHHTASIVTAYVSNNSIPSSEVTALIDSVHSTIAKLNAVGSAPAPAEPPRPAVPIRKSVAETYIVCLEDGRRFKSLKRHLRDRYNMTPEQYRAKWSLPPDYPMVAPGYAEMRSRMAKDMGLGRGAARKKPG